MKLLFHNISILLCIFWVACDQQPDIDGRYSKTNLSIPIKYKLLDFKSDWGVGETTEDYTLLISKEDFQRISKEIEEKNYFQRLDTAKAPSSVFNNNSDTRIIYEIACWYDNKYYYQIFRSDPGVVITVVLEKDSLMSINYNDL